MDRHSVRPAMPPGVALLPGSFPYWEFTIWYRVPPSPFWLQNLENNGSILGLCARSLSLQELQAKSREHGSCGGCEGLASHFGTGYLEPGPRQRRGRIVKDR